MTTTAKTPAIIKSMTIAKLIEVFIDTNKFNDPNIFTVRGWIMDELETRNPEAFDAWLESDPCEDTDLPKYFNC